MSFVFKAVHPSVSLCVCPSVILWVCPVVSLSVCQLVHLFVCLFVRRLSYNNGRGSSAKARTRARGRTRIHTENDMYAFTHKSIRTYARIHTHRTHTLSPPTHTYSNKHYLIYAHTDERKNEPNDERMDGRTKEGTNEQTNELTDELTNQPTNKQTWQSLSLFSQHEQLKRGDNCYLMIRYEYLSGHVMFIADQSA